MFGYTGINHQEGKWPENPNPTEIDQRMIYPGEGKVFEDN